MDEKNFVTIAFCSIIAIAVVCIATLYFMNVTGQYYTAGFGPYVQEYGMCYCHPGTFSYAQDGSISGQYVTKVGSVSEAACVNECGAGHTYWKGFTF
jgi:hypothetical protein